VERNILDFGFSVSVLGQNILVFNKRLEDFNFPGFTKFLVCFFFVLILKISTKQTLFYKKKVNLYKHRYKLGCL